MTEVEAMSAETKTGDIAIGQVQWHSSEEGSGPDVGLLLRLTDTTYLWAGEILRDDWEAAGPDAAELGDDFGWWFILYEATGTRFDKTVLGRCINQHTAQNFIDQIAPLLASQPLAQPVPFGLPLATEAQAAVGWTLQLDYLDQVRKQVVETTGYDATIEVDGRKYKKAVRFVARQALPPSPVEIEEP